MENVADNVVQMPAAGIESVRDEARKEPTTIEERIKALEAEIEQLEAQRTRSVVEELVLEPEALAAVAKQRAKERFPRAQKEVERHLKQLAWSGERLAMLEPNSPIFNNMLIQWLKDQGFSPQLVKVAGEGKSITYKIQVQW